MDQSKKKKNSSKIEFYRDISLPQEMRKITNKQLLHLKGLWKEQQAKPKINRKTNHKYQNRNKYTHTHTHKHTPRRKK